MNFEGKSVYIKDRGATGGKKINFSLFLVGCAFLFFLAERLMMYSGGYWAPILETVNYLGEASSYSYVYQKNIWTMLAQYLAVFCLLLAALLRYRKAENRLGSTALLSFFVLFVSVAFWTAHTYLTGGDIFAPNSPLVFLTVAGIFLGFCENTWNFIARHALKLSLLFFLLCTYSIVQFSLRFGAAETGNGPIIVYFVTGFWLLVVAALGREEQSSLYQVLVMFTIAGAFMITIYYRTRGFMLQTILLILVYIIKIVKKGSKHVVKRLIFFLCSVIVLLLAAFFLIPDQFGLLLERLTSDSRSSQYRDIFGQVGFFQMLFGSGYDFSYVSSVKGEYSHIDNNYLEYLLRYGIQTILPYTILMLKPIFGLLGKRGGKNSGFYATAIIMWAMALGGLSVFNVITLDLKSFLAMAVVGRGYYLCSTTRPKEKENTEELACVSQRS